MSKPITQTRYISLNFGELDKLQELGFETQALYLIMKRLADFKTGVLGKFHRQKISYTKLADQLSRPASQGKPAQIFDRSQVSRIIDHMEAAGLVDERSSASGKLTLRLPLSPITQAEVATPEAAQNKAKVKKAPQNKFLPPAGESLLAVDCDDPFGSPSVLAPSEPINTFLINTERALKTLAPGARKIADAAAYPPSPGTGGEIEIGATLTIPRIKAILREAGVIYIDTPISKEYYDRWIKHGVSETKLRSEIEVCVAFDAALVKPGDLDRFLIPPACRPVSRLNANRGRVVL